MCWQAGLLIEEEVGCFGPERGVFGGRWAESGSFDLVSGYYLDFPVVELVPLTFNFDVADVVTVLGRTLMADDSFESVETPIFPFKLLHRKFETT